MADPESVLVRVFQQAIAAAFPEHRDTDPAIRLSAHADYQANVAMALGKRVGKPPREIAKTLLEHLPIGDVVAKAEIAGPGFINVTLRDAFVAQEITAVAKDPALDLGAPADRETVVVDYSSPNVAKELHVGHLRSTILGDCLARVLEALGHKVIRQNHLGDWGTPFGMLIEHMLDLGGAARVDIRDLDGFYKQARAKFDADAAFAERSRARVVKLQAGDAETLTLWRGLVEQSTRYFAELYTRLGIALRPADIAGESFYNPLLNDVVAALRDAGLAKDSDGAVCTFPPGFTSKEGTPLPLIVQKQDGGFGYAATDLAAIRHRARTLGATRILYVVGAPQAQHFAMVFATAKAAGWITPSVRAEHVAFGLILGPDKKPFKTRSGENVKLATLIDEAEARAIAVVRAKAQELDEAELLAIGRAVGVGALKYADLSSDRIKDYVFDWDRMLSLDGNTAPYLMYAHARIRSIVRKAGEAPKDAAITLGAPEERALALVLLRFGAVIAEVGRTLTPHTLCTYLFDLATAFTAFYQTCSVLHADTPAQRDSRLALCEVTARTLSRGLALLGIEAPERM